MDLLKKILKGSSIDDDNLKRFLPEILRLKDEFEKNGIDIFNLVGEKKIACFFYLDILETSPPRGGIFIG